MAPSDCGADPHRKGRLTMKRTMREWTTRIGSAIIASAAQRFPKLTLEQMNAAQRAVAGEITAGPRGEVRGPFIALLHNPSSAPCAATG